MKSFSSKYRNLETSLFDRDIWNYMPSPAIMADGFMFVSHLHHKKSAVTPPLVKAWGCCESHITVFEYVIVFVLEERILLMFSPPNLQTSDFGNQTMRRNEMRKTQAKIIKTLGYLSVMTAMCSRFTQWAPAGFITQIWERNLILHPIHISPYLRRCF